MPENVTQGDKSNYFENVHGNVTINQTIVSSKNQNRLVYELNREEELNNFDNIILYENNKGFFVFSYLCTKRDAPNILNYRLDYEKNNVAFLKPQNSWIEISEIINASINPQEVLIRFFQKIVEVIFGDKIYRIQSNSTTSSINTLSEMMNYLFAKQKESKNKFIAIPISIQEKISLKDGFLNKFNDMLTELNSAFSSGTENIQIVFLLALNHEVFQEVKNSIFFKNLVTNQLINVINNEGLLELKQINGGHITSWAEKHYEGNFDVIDEVPTILNKYLAEKNKTLPLPYGELFGSLEKIVKEIESKQ